MLPHPGDIVWYPLLGGILRFPAQLLAYASQIGGRLGGTGAPDPANELDLKLAPRDRLFHDLYHLGQGQPLATAQVKDPMRWRIGQSSYGESPTAVLGRS